jgi:uncharacterized membrane protein
VTRTLFYVAAGLLLGAAMHIAIVLLVPLFATEDAWTRAGALGPDGVFHLLPPLVAGSGDAQTRDPEMVEAVCRFSLGGDNTVRIRADLPDTFWSLGLLDQRGRNVYSFNDTSSERSRLELAVMAAADFAALGGNPPAGLQNAVVAPFGSEAGIAVVRVFVPDEASRAAVTAALTMAACGSDS